jgi:nitrogen-specific signal transduction histidine kinase/ActR/RegA family two-component response regulator
MTTPTPPSKPDLTTRVEQQMAIMEKMDALRRMAGGIAHDFNNVLMLVFGYCDVLMEKVHPDGPLYAYLREIKAAGDQAARLTRLLMVFSAQRVFQPVTMNLNAIVSISETALRTALGPKIKLDLDLCRERCLAKVEPEEIEHVLLHLARNAADAMPRGGEFTVRTTIVDHIAGQSGAHELPPGRYVCLTARDTGAGMSADVLGHVFEPFFTTYEDGRHVGLGLFSTYAVVTQIEGHVFCESTPGRGTTVTMYLPLCTTPAAAPAAPRRPVPLVGTETILLVEDDQRVRVLLRDLLALRGYTIIDAEDAQEALLKLSQARATVNLLLTDVVMPGMNGRELAEQALQICPTLKVIFTSGYTEDECLRRQVLLNNAHFLQKPFVPQKLLEKLRDVLDAPRGAQGHQTTAS